MTGRHPSLLAIKPEGVGCFDLVIKQCFDLQCPLLYHFLGQFPPEVAVVVDGFAPSCFVRFKVTVSAIFEPVNVTSFRNVKLQNFADFNWYF
jgi:hypothetical protein